MVRYMVTRMFSAVIVLLAIISITFLLMHAIPGGPFTAEKNIPALVLKNIEEHYKLNDPLWKQYFDYVRNLLSLDLGPSFKYAGRSVNDIIADIHYKLTGGKERITLTYESSLGNITFETALSKYRERDLRMKSTTVGPHRDDICFTTDAGLDIRKFGSQGQQRTAALSLKLSEIELVKEELNDTPILLLDDVLSELDKHRQNYLLDSIDNIQTIITCTGLDEFVNHRFSINKIFHIKNGHAVNAN